ncbi:uncharacterized protein BO80DRAFT_124515 [Aspergillus ibericus CBS 121593]|uniref:Uncharacterized protein n=1 Tax=Aspergillus ibericus CBS 121593 TaxID=1448316 RepID=A0A395GVD8_9EURO|nr:hypothetical protein BO80DRAFT_124515 [Aspergillus ibericus CBS 121593]RAK99465.1 hypothetical protein BO80DRAFT_124515 [Aspergillus ibericus CBS 121593]
MAPVTWCGHVRVATILKKNGWKKIQEQEKRIGVYGHRLGTKRKKKLVRVHSKAAARPPLSLSLSSAFTVYLIFLSPTHRNSNQAVTYTSITCLCTLFRDSQHRCSNTST